MPHVDGALCWPGNAKLRPILADVQRLNPSLSLRCAITGSGREILLFAGSATDLVEIVFPEPVADSVMIGLTYANRDLYPIETDLGTVDLNPRRFDRTATGSLVVRPQSDAVSDARNRVSIRYHRGLPAPSLEKPSPLQSQLVRRWVIPTGAWQLWEVEFGFLPPGHLDKVPDTDREWWILSRSARLPLSIGTTFRSSNTDRARAIRRGRGPRKQ